MMQGAWHNHSIDVPERFAAVIDEWIRKVVRSHRDESALYVELKYGGARYRRSIGHVWPQVESKMSMRFCYCWGI